MEAILGAAEEDLIWKLVLHASKPMSNTYAAILM